MVTKARVADFGAHLSAENSADQAAIARLYKALPDWLPEPIMPQIRQALATLRNAGQVNPIRIERLVARGRRNELVIPDVLDPIDFVKSVNYLGHVQWALSLDKERALQELAGTMAAKTYRNLRRGKDEQTAASAAAMEQRNRDLRTQAAELRTQNHALSENAIATRLAQTVPLSTKQIRRILAKAE